MLCQVVVVVVVDILTNSKPAAVQTAFTYYLESLVSIDVRSLGVS